MRANMTRHSTQFNIVMLIASLVLGAVSWILGLLVYNATVDVWPRPLVIGVSFGILALFVLMGVLIVSTIQGTFTENILAGGGLGSVLVVVFAAIILITALGALFQWIYGLHYEQELTEPTSYVFIIDDSGSMESNDPSQLRYTAINEVLKKKPSDFPYMVYGFSDQVSLLREMSPISSGYTNITGNSYGGTSIKGALEQVISDYQNNVWEGGESPKVILLTDGYATDLGWFTSINSTLKQYSQNRISVSTVGLGSVDKSLMQKIAAKTGGVFVDIADAAMLGEAMESAANQYSVDDLLTTRYSTRMGILFGFLRILFIAILGSCIGFVSAVAYGQMDASSLVIVSSIIQSLVGAILMEVLTSGLGVSDRFCWFILWILIAAMICTQVVTYRRGPSRPSRGRGRSSHMLR